VDFLTRHHEGRQELIQVCVDLDSAVVRDREFRALLDSAKKYPKAELHIVVLNVEAVRDVPKPIQINTALTWLLDHCQ